MPLQGDAGTKGGPASTHSSLGIHSHPWRAHWLRRNQGPPSEHLRGGWSSAQGLRSTSSCPHPQPPMPKGNRQDLSAHRLMAVSHDLLLAPVHNRPSEELKMFYMDITRQFLLFGSCRRLGATRGHLYCVPRPCPRIPRTERTQSQEQSKDLPGEPGS